jgi:peptidoglycan/LPS O-acetylase OafA/YrhL
MEIRKLNTLRGLAALIVVVSHYSNETGILRGWLGNGAGQIGVMLFFILSGFLMSYLYMDGEFDKENVRYFVIARIARVIPLFLLVVLASYFLQAAGVIGILFGIDDLKSLLSHVLMFSGTSVLWTIPPEIQFYALFLFLWWLYFRNKGYLYSLLFLTFIGLIILEYPNPQWKLFGLELQTYLFRSLPYFFTGMLFGRMYPAWKAPGWLRKNIFVLVLLGLPLIYPDIFSFLTGRTHKMWADTGIFFALSGMFFVLIFFVPEDNLILANPMGDFLGMISYSLYLLHIPILNLVGSLAEKSPTRFFIGYIALSLMIAYLTFRAFEAPARNKIRSALMNNRMRHN